MGKHYTNEIKQQVIDDYNSGKFGGRYNLSKYYNIPDSTITFFLLY